MKFSIKARLKSFRYAINGLALVWKSQHNFRIHLAVFSLVLLAGFLCRITLTEWCLVLLVSALVMGLEIINSAVEMLVDLVSPDFHEKAGKIKDLCAAAVLLASVTAFITGVLVFGKYLISLFKSII